MSDEPEVQPLAADTTTPDVSVPTVDAAPTPDPTTPAPPPPPLPQWRVRLRPEHGALAVIVVATAVLNTYRLAQNGFANVFYSAAVKSMLLSFHNFFFVAFDPSGLVTVDKPPIGLWLQAISAKLFGFHPLSILLPQAIAGVIAVAAIYFIVARRCGPLAGLVSAATLAVFPSFAASARDNNLDVPLILWMVLACGATLRATETGKLRWLLTAALLVGVAFNTKTLAAYLVVPGIGLAYLVGAPVPVRRRIGQLALAGVLLAVLSGAWIEAVDLTPAAHRPYVGGSTDNSEYNLTTQYNGVGRVGGQSGGPGRVPVVTIRLPAAAKAAARAAAEKAAKTKVTVNPHPLITFGGSTGPARLFDSELGDQGGWMLPFALVGLLALGLASRRRRRDPELAVLIVFGTWFLVEALVLSLGQGIIHPYYVSALGPGTAAVAGAGAAAMADLARRGSWRRVVGILALAFTAIAQITMLQREHVFGWAVVLLIAGCALSAVGLLLLRRWLNAAIAVGVISLLIAPTAIAQSTWNFDVQGTFPAAGPTASAGHGGVGLDPGGERYNKLLLAWIDAHHPGSRWQILTDASTVAAPMILLGAKAGALGGYSGTDPVLNGASLARLVALHEARFMFMGGVYWSRGGNAATTAIVNVCKAVPPAIWHAGATPHNPHAPPVSRYVPSPASDTLVLYDCLGRARQLTEFSATGVVTVGVHKVRRRRRTRLAHEHVYA